MSALELWPAAVREAAAAGALDGIAVVAAMDDRGALHVLVRPGLDADFWYEHFKFVLHQPPVVDRVAL